MIVISGSHTYSNQSVSYQNPAVAEKPFLLMEYSDGAVGKTRNSTSNSRFRMLTPLCLPLRICAGRHLAERSVWIALVRILATLKISPARDAEGNLVEHEFKTSEAFTM